MILPTPRLAALREFGADVHVIGSGPAGIVTALAPADRGFRVLVLESGGEAAGGAGGPLERFYMGHLSGQMSYGRKRVMGPEKAAYRGRRPRLPESLR
jgi:choline dehydrogenase-like flavoprotein